ncbi:unnamed protein product [Pleuronectes platessa]|uniref:Uncharacterized protein n=1 Tax=Pleuronectes platessa TaxID=8262 RepID=A0A9N7U6Q9_PLEPL|nr:unnamed protein product [Pleuronectes platessa]
MDAADLKVPLSFPARMMDAPPVLCHPAARQMSASGVETHAAANEISHRHSLPRSSGTAGGGFSPASDPDQDLCIVLLLPLVLGPDECSGYQRVLQKHCSTQ